MYTQKMEQLRIFSSDDPENCPPGHPTLNLGDLPLGQLTSIVYAQDNNRPKSDEGPSLSQVHHTNEAMDTEEPYHQTLEPAGLTEPMDQGFLNHKGTMLLKNKILKSKNSRVKREMDCLNKVSSINTSAQEHHQYLTPVSTVCVGSSLSANHLAPMHKPSSYALPRTGLHTPNPLPISQATIQKPPIPYPPIRNTGQSLAGSTPKVPSIQPTSRNNPLPPSSDLEMRSFCKAPKSNIPRSGLPLKQHVAAEGQPASSRQRTQEPSDVAPSKRRPPDSKGLGGFFNSITIEGHVYYPIRSLGRGGTSSVFYALDGNHIAYAIKQVRIKNQPDAANFIRNEIDILRRLSDCEWAIKLYHCEVRPHFAYFAMELGDINFEALLKNQDQTCIDMDFIRLYWRHMLSGVQAIHSYGIVHTDLKPDNFVLAQGVLKLIDFGIARSIPIGSTSVIVDDEIGTIGYMAPEALRHASLLHSSPLEPVSIKLRASCDIWSLGCILYFMTYRLFPYQLYSQKDQTSYLRGSNPASYIKTPLYIYTASKPLSVPPVLIETMWSCLKNVPSERFTITQLLEESPLLHPRY